MTRIQQRHRLDALLETQLDLAQPADFVELLAALAVETDEAVRGRAIERLASARPSLDDLERWLQGFEVSVPTDWREEHAWIVSVETVGLAAEAARELQSLLGDEVAESLTAKTIAFLLAFDERLWMNDLVAEESRAGPLPEVIPWKKIRSGIEQGRLRPTGPVEPAVLDAWLEDRLHAEDAAALARWVGQAGPWQQTYREGISELARRAVVSRFDVSRSISVAADDAELGVARLVQDLPLPHLGHGARREGRLHAEGTHWRLVDASTTDERLVPYGETTLRWSDAVLGELSTELLEAPADELSMAEDAMASVIELSAGLAHPRARSIALAIAQDLRAGSLCEGLAAAARAFDHAQLEADTEIRWAACALRTQLALERLGHRLADAELDASMAAAERALMPHASGLLLLEDAHRRDLTHGYDIDPDAWWGVHERLDERVPEAIVHRALGDLAAASSADRGPVVSLAAYRAAVEHELRASDRAKGRELRAAAAVSRSPGEVDLLVALEGPARIGRTLRVSVKRGSGDPFGTCPQFAPVARDAIRDAYAATAAACPSGVPPLRLEDHKFIVHELLDITAIDGSSLGLAFVLAFASLWLDQPLDADLAATGRVYRGASGDWLVGSVEHVPAKAAAHYIAAGERGARLMASPEHEAEILAFEHQPLSVATVAEALRHAGLDLPRAELVGVWPDIRQRLKAIGDLIEVIDAQDVEPFAGWGDPWRFLGDRMALLVGGLQDDVDERVPRGKVYGALAYVHAGDPKAAASLLAGVHLDHTSGVTRAMKLIVELDQVIDESSWERCDELSTALAELEADHLGQPWVGLAKGTRGRSRLHSGDPTGAVVLFEDAVAHQVSHARHEAGRARVYLANALRNAGRLTEARVQLETASDELETHTKPWSRPYYVQCRAYWLYERARLAIVQGDPRLAIDLAGQAYVLVRRQGFWPALGILRVLAWGHRMLGQPDEADLFVDRIEALLVPPAHRDLRDRILEEAEGLPVLRGEVY